MQLLNTPNFDKSMRSILLSMDKGWQGYVEPRFAPSAVNNEIKVEPHQLDGLSWSMTLVRIIAKMKMFQHKELNIVVMGGSAKGEERIFCQTNYFQELSNFFPEVSFKVYIVGPEMSDQRH